MALWRVLWWRDWKEKEQMKGPGLLEISLKKLIPELKLWACADGAKESWAVATLVGAGFLQGRENRAKATKLCDAKCSVAIPDLPQARVPADLALYAKLIERRGWACLGVTPTWAWRKYSFAYFLLFCPLLILSSTAPCNLCLNQLWKKANFCIRCFWTFSIAYTLKSFREIFFCNWNMHTWSALTLWVLFRVTTMASHFFPEGLVSAIENLILVLIIQGSLGAYIFLTTKFIILFIGP